jgi:cation diffusion facilitator CzcD-associated flavoprotein CzcO
MALQMSRPDGIPHPLPEELDRALRRATDRTVVALTSLRKAVRQHVHDERDRGTSLQEIELELRAIIMRVLKDAEGRESVDGERETLATQMLKWSKGFYNQQD